MTAWSAVAATVWGKTDQKLDAWMSLVQHLQDSAGVAGHLWDTWVPTAVRDRMARDLGSLEAARTLTVWVTGVHDVGKATPAFAQLARDVNMGDLVDAMSRAGLTSPALARSDRWRHDVTGQVAVAEWLAQQGWSSFRAGALASVVGAHHGLPPPSADVDRAGRDPSMGGEAWRRVREEILDGITDLAGSRDTLDSLRTRK
ncbi:CRISPR-associated endonuclease Cas3'' [Ornithinimicrobium cavernae]|uniref:CRISPR-associated endonuclease Cas3'' n=1 Tax=Ornithinimicrobium cavernae TaxID=2666047 RepID=UPI0012B186C7|nr:CRISPR-associated endonuclease Cas3'' [Ornithinimicrobium cavernae]